MEKVGSEDLNEGGVAQLREAAGNLNGAESRDESLQYTSNPKKTPLDTFALHRTITKQRRPKHGHKIATGAVGRGRHLGLAAPGGPDHEDVLGHDFLAHPRL